MNDPLLWGCTALALFALHQWVIRPIDFWRRSRRLDAFTETQPLDLTKLEEPLAAFLQQEADAITELGFTPLDWIYTEMSKLSCVQYIFTAAKTDECVIASFVLTHMTTSELIPAMAFWTDTEDGIQLLTEASPIASRLRSQPWQDRLCVWPMTSFAEMLDIHRLRVAEYGGRPVWDEGHPPNDPHHLHQRDQDRFMADRVERGTYSTNPDGEGFTWKLADAWKAHLHITWPLASIHAARHQRTTQRLRRLLAQRNAARQQK